MDITQKYWFQASPNARYHDPDQYWYWDGSKAWFASRLEGFALCPSCFHPEGMIRGGYTIVNDPTVPSYLTLPEGI